MNIRGGGVSLVITDVHRRRNEYQTELDTQVVHSVNNEYQGFSVFKDCTANALNIPPGNYDRKVETLRN